MEGLMFEHGFDIYLEKATLQYNNLFTGDDIWVYGKTGKKSIRPRAKDAFIGEMQHAVDTVASGKDSDVISGSSAREALRVCLKEQQAAISGKPVNI